MGAMEMFSTVDRRLCQQEEADSISEALRRAMRHMTLTTLISATPTVANVLTTEVVLMALVVLNVLVALAAAVALMVLLTVLNIDESISISLHLVLAINTSDRILIDCTQLVFMDIYRYPLRGE